MTADHALTRKNPDFTKLSKDMFFGEVQQRKAKILSSKPMTHNKNIIQRVEKDDYTGLKLIKFNKICDIIEEQARITYIGINSLLKNIPLENMNIIIQWPLAYIEKLPWLNHVLDILKRPTAYAEMSDVFSKTEVAFGLDSRTDEDIGHAVSCGYRIFDGGDTYGNINILAAHIKAKKIDRKNVKVVYKIGRDYKGIKDLENHIIAVANLFDGYLDYVLIHKLTLLQHRKHIPVLNSLKQVGFIKHVGGGDLTEDMEDNLRMDSYEIDAHDIMLNPDLVTILNGTAKPVFIYNIVGTVREVLHCGATPAILCQFIGHLQGKVPKAIPILSSSKEEVVKTNLTILKDTELDYDEEVMKNQEILDNYYISRSTIVNLDNMDPTLKGRIKTVIYAPRFAEYSNGSDKKAGYEKRLGETLCLFTADELKVMYKGNGKTFSLKTAITMLYDKTNCKRVEAYEFFTDSIFP